MRLAGTVAVVTTALAVIDMLNSYVFDHADRLAESVERALPAIVGLIERARAQGAPIIYVNDNFGRWDCDRHALVRRLLDGRRANLIEPIVPEEDALFVVKARHSIFYETPLGYLLRSEEIDRLVLTGQVTEQCILYSALDAHIRHVPTVIPRDAVAHIDPELARAALRMMEVNMDAEVCDSAEVRFS